jgi:hypothetical protein
MPQTFTTLSYGPAGNQFALDSLGEITVASQSSKFTPDKLGQKETRQVHFFIQVFQQSFDENYSLISQARDALQDENQVLTWTTPATVLSNGSTVPGTVILNRPVNVISHDLPEDSNSWGTYKVRFSVVVEFEVDVTDTTVHMAATFLRTGASGGPTSLGQIWTFKPSYRATKYSEMRNIRERAAGTVVVTGEIFVGLADVMTSPVTDNRRATLEAAVAALDAQVNGRDGVLAYGLVNGPQFFNQLVRVVDFDANINQALNGITYSFTADWTEFPNEATYCAADIRVDRQEDRETGEKSIRLTGNIGAPSPTVANAKLTLLMQTVIANAIQSDGDQGWNTLVPRVFSTTPRYINSDDTQTLPSGAAKPANPMGTVDANGFSQSTSVFIGMDINIEWRKKSANLVSWKLSIDTTDDASTGMQRISYTGSVVASGASANAAYAAASAQAAILGDNKYPFRLTSKLVRHDRFIDAETPTPASFNPIVGLPAAAGYTGSGLQEFVECTFSYEYRMQGQRIYMEYTAAVNTPAFGENSIRITGFVVGGGANPQGALAGAQAAYLANVRNNYNTNLILDEDVSDSTDLIQGTALAPLGDSTSILFARLSFSLSVWTPKPTGSFAVQYMMKVDLDYVKLTRSTSLEGTFFGAQSDIIAAETYAANNVLDTWLTAAPSIVPAGAVKLNDSRSQNHDYLSTKDFQMALKFSMNIVSVLPVTGGMSAILQCALDEKLAYSGNRNVEFKTPDGPSVIQPVGIKCGNRTVSGSVTAATETAGRAWIRTQVYSGSQAFLQLFPSSASNAGGPPPASRYQDPPEISARFVFLPLTSGVARTAAPNAQFVELSFSFSEMLPSFGFNP